MSNVLVMSTLRITRDALRLAAEADSDPRTAERFLRGEPVRGRVADRLARAAQALGVETKGQASNPPTRAA